MFWLGVLTGIAASVVIGFTLLVAACGYAIAKGLNW